MKILLAPMEGVVDAIMRDTITRIGGVDACVTEFIRVTDHLFPDKVFYRRCPELYNHSQTPTGTPVRVQLLGGQPEPVAENALRAAQLGASAIDLNFGCPAKTVNKSDGGACLLRQPDRVHAIVTATRQRVPKSIPVTAKIRLGYDDRSRYLDNALAVFSAGADELTVHARSKADGYKPPAYWEYIAEIRESITIPVIANGDIWSVDDLLRCQSITGCQQFMLGRGLMACPDLARQIKSAVAGETATPMSWAEICQWLLPFFERTVTDYSAKHTGNRLKQWLFYLSRQYSEAQILFESIKRCREAQPIRQAIINAQSL